MPPLGSPPMIRMARSWTARYARSMWVGGVGEGGREEGRVGVGSEKVLLLLGSVAIVWSSA
eukprot:542431-Pelagomonas_calceolata.AAC.1